ncbi:MAG: DUF58 domain-containing protein [Bacteroidota bacterium]
MPFAPGSLWRQFVAGYRGLFLTDRFFQAIGAICVIAILAFWQSWLFFLPIILLIALLGLTIYDIYLLFQKRLRFSAFRRLPKVLSLGDRSKIDIEIANLSPLPLRLKLIDELPEQLQIRDLEMDVGLMPKQRQKLSYQIRPLERGQYFFGNLQLYAQTSWRLVQRRVEIQAKEELPVYPSIIQMKQYALQAFSATVPMGGMRKMRRLGKSYEFDQIKNYVLGDDYRSINWRATGRRSDLMVNQYEDERAQQIYCVIDKSRSMLMPFEGLSLLDHAINSSLALANVVIRKHDRAGLITFSDKIGSVIRADSKSTQLQRIIQALYREKERDTEANYELLYYASRTFITGRSLLLMFSNFESEYALDRVLPILRRINRSHLLVVVLFENTEISDTLQQPMRNTEDIYFQATARHFMYQKEMLAQRLRQYGIQVVLTRPEDLTLNTINKYLELKQRGLI